MRVIVARCGRDLCEDISALIETDNVNLAAGIRGKLGILGVRLFYTGAIDEHILEFALVVLLLQLEHNTGELLRGFLITNLGDVNAVGVVVGGMHDCCTCFVRVGVIGIGQSNGILLAFTEYIGVNLSRVELCLIVHIDFGATTNGNILILVRFNFSLKVVKRNNKLVLSLISDVVRSVAAFLDLSIVNLDLNNRFTVGP